MLQKNCQTYFCATIFPTFLEEQLTYQRKKQAFSSISCIFPRCKKQSDKIVWKFFLFFRNIDNILVWAQTTLNFFLNVTAKEEVLLRHFCLSLLLGFKCTKKQRGLQSSVQTPDQRQILLKYTQTLTYNPHKNPCTYTHTHTHSHTHTLSHIRSHTCNPYRHRHITNKPYIQPPLSDTHTHTNTYLFFAVVGDTLSAIKNEPKRRRRRVEKEMIFFAHRLFFVRGKNFTRFGHVLE